MRYLVVFTFLLVMVQCTAPEQRNSTTKEQASENTSLTSPITNEAPVTDSSVATQELPEAVKETPKPATNVESHQKEPKETKNVITAQQEKSLPAPSPAPEPTSNISSIPKKVEAVKEIAETTTSVEMAEKEAEKEAEKVTEKLAEVAEVKKSVEKQPAPSALDAYDAFLRKYVSGKGFVQYNKMLQDQALLDTYLNWAAAHPGHGSTRAEKMAYWINVYNANTLKLILDHYPVKSILDLENGKVWKKKWIQMTVGVYSLDQIEHEILRKKYPDARIHFAVNCAAYSCPPLLNKAWRAATLDADLENQTNKFVNNSNFNTLADAKVSQIFNWYAEDFGDLKTFINKYAQTPIPANKEILFIEYNWDLNGN